MGPKLNFIPGINTQIRSWCTLICVDWVWLCNNANGEAHHSKGSGPEPISLLKTVWKPFLFSYRSFLPLVEASIRLQWPWKYSGCFAWRWQNLSTLIDQTWANLEEEWLQRKEKNPRTGTGFALGVAVHQYLRAVVVLGSQIWRVSAH